MNSLRLSFCLLLPATLLPAVSVAQAVPKTAKKMPAVLQESAETVKMPPVFREAAADGAGFPQTGRVLWRLHADKSGKVVRREQKADPALAKQAAALKPPAAFPPRERCVLLPQAGGATESVCRNIPFIAEQEVYFLIPRNLTADKTRFSAALETVTPQPAYPARSLEREEKGMVRVRFAIGTDGRAHGTSVEKSSGYRLLDRAAVKAMDSARFRPATFRGRPVWMRAARSFDFDY